MNGIILDGLLLQKLIKSRFPAGHNDLIALWDASGEGLNPSTIYRWTRGQLPRTGEDLLKLAAILDVDPFTLLTFDRGSATEAIERLLLSFERNKWERLGFFRAFFGRQKYWPPDEIATRYFGRNWCRAHFTHEPSDRANYYATIRLDGFKHQDDVAPQAFHFAFRQPGWFADRWLDYGFVVRAGCEVKLLHINGQSESYKTRSLEEPAYVETFFGPSTVEFCIASLHPFTHCVAPVDTCSDFRVRFQA